jgi:hypothetical protein
MCEKVRAMKIKGIGACINKNQRKEYFFAFDLA